MVQHRECHHDRIGEPSLETLQRAPARCLHKYSRCALCASTSSSSAAYVMAKLFSAQYPRLDATDRWPSLPSSSLWQATNTYASSFRGSGQPARDFRTVRSRIAIRRVFLVFAPVQHVIAEALRCVKLRGGRLGRFWRRDFRRTRLRGSRRVFLPILSLPNDPPACPGGAR